MCDSRPWTERGTPLRLGLLAGVLAVAVVPLSGCSLLFVDGPPARPVASERPLPPEQIECTDDALLPILDLTQATVNSIFVSLDAYDEIELSVGEVVGLTIGAFVYYYSGYSGLKDVRECRLAKLRSPEKAWPRDSVIPVATEEKTEQIPGTRSHHVFLSRTTEFDMKLLLGIHPNNTAEDTSSWFGEPTLKQRLDAPTAGGCTRVWTWIRGNEALAISFKDGGTICLVSVAGGPPLRSTDR